MFILTYHLWIAHTDTNSISWFLDLPLLTQFFQSLIHSSIHSFPWCVDFRFIVPMAPFPIVPPPPPPPPSPPPPPIYSLPPNRVKNVAPWLVLSLIAWVFYSSTESFIHRIIHSFMAKHSFNLSSRPRQSKSSNLSFISPLFSLSLPAHDRGRRGQWKCRPVQLLPYWSPDENDTDAFISFVVDFNRTDIRGQKRAAAFSGQPGTSQDVSHIHVDIHRHTLPLFSLPPVSFKLYLYTSPHMLQTIPPTQNTP